MGDSVLLTDEEFLKYNHRALMKIARGRNQQRREWLSEFLDDCDDTAAAQSLARALQTERK